MTYTSGKLCIRDRYLASNEGRLIAQFEWKYPFYVCARTIPFLIPLSFITLFFVKFFATKAYNDTYLPGDELEPKTDTFVDNFTQSPKTRRELLAQLSSGWLPLNQRGEVLDHEENKFRRDEGGRSIYTTEMNKVDHQLQALSPVRTLNKVHSTGGTQSPRDSPKKHHEKPQDSPRVQSKDMDASPGRPGDQMLSAHGQVVKDPYPCVILVSILE
ncbi:hypothetical protein BDN72DRAFT_878303, partial [Pluteus cervinus]